MNVKKCHSLQTFYDSAPSTSNKIIIICLRAFLTLFSAVTSAVATDPTSSTCSPTTLPQSTLPQSTIIAVASSAALLALLSIALLVTITGCFITLKRERKKQRKPHPADFQHQQNSVLLDYNPAYNDRHPGSNINLNLDNQYQEQQIDHEPYYSLVTQEEDDTTSETHDSYVEIQPTHNNNTKDN